jgi:hypothetical protein
MAGIFEKDSEEEALRIVREFDADSGHELYRVTLKPFNSGSRESSLMLTNANPTLSRPLRSSMSRAALTYTEKAVHHVSSAAAKLDPRRPSHHAFGDVPEKEEVMGASTTGSSSASPNSGELPGIKLHLDGIGISLLDASPLQIVYAAADQVVVSVAPSEHERHVNSRIAQQVDLTMTGMATIAAFPNKLSLLLRLIPALNVSASVLNLQVDSLVPGGFFACPLRPLHVRSQLWRSLECYMPPQQVTRALRRPVLTVEIKGCQLMGRKQGGGAVVVSSCRAKLDEIALNIDEAFLVALSAYYCRVAVYFSLKPFNEQETAEGEDPTSHPLRNPADIMGKKSQVAGTSSDATSRTAAPLRRDGPSWLLTVEEELHIEDNTSYLSIRLMESANPYVEGLQRDEQVGVLLGFFLPLYAAALFQPAMLSHHSRALMQSRVCMSLKELLKLINEHFVAPINRKIGLFLWISFDWLGNPSKLFFGIMAGFRELFMQPYRKGIRGIPRGIKVCLCSVFGSIFDSLARIINSLFKSIDRILRIVHTQVGMKTVRQGTLILSLSRAPINKWDGLRRGALLAMLQCRTVALNVHEVTRLFIARGRKEYRGIVCFFVVFAFTLVLTVVLGLIEAILLFLYNVLQGIVATLYRRSAEDVCDWDPIQLVALEIPVSIRPPRPREQEDTCRGIVAPFAYLPCLVRAQMDPDEGLVAPWQWQRWSSGEEGGHEAVLSAFWCGATDPESSRHRAQDTNILFETPTKIALLNVTNWGDVLASGRPRKPKARFKHLWQIEKVGLASIAFLRVEAGSWQDENKAGTLRFQLHAPEDIGKSKKSVVAPSHTVLFASRYEAFRALEILSRSLGPSSA